MSRPNLRWSLPGVEIGHVRCRPCDLVPGRQQLSRGVPGALDQLPAHALGDDHRVTSAARGDPLPLQVEGALEPGLGLAALHQPGHHRRVDGDAGDAERLTVAGEDLGERLPDDGLDAAAPAHDRLRRVLPRRAAAEVAVDEQYTRGTEAGIVERVQLAGGPHVRAVILEGGGAEALEDDAFEEPCRDDAVSVDVVTANGDRRSSDPGALCVFHAQAPSEVIPNRSRASVPSPAMAAAATMTGDMSSVRPVGEPWRPLKLRF